MRTSVVAALAGMLFGVSGVALGQDSPPTTDQNNPGTEPVVTDATTNTKEVSGKDWTLTLGGGMQHAFRADLDDAGDVSVTRAGGDLTLSFLAAPKLQASVGFESEVSIYDFDGADGLIGSNSDAWDELYLVGFNVALSYQFDDEWSMFGGGFINAGFESGADFGDSIFGGGFAGLTWEASPSLTVRFGGGVRTQIEDNVDVLPVVGFDWRITDQVTLRTQGLGLRLSAKLNKEWTVYFGGEYQSRQYRLDEDRSVLPNGVVRDRSVPIGVGVVWTPLPGLSIAVEGGAVVWQEYELLNEHGVERGEENTDPSPYVGVRLEYRF